MSLPDEDAKKIGLGILQVLADALGGEVRRDQRQHAAEQQVWREDVEHSAAHAEREQQLRLNAERELADIVKTMGQTQMRLERELAELQELYDAERMQRKQAERRYKETVRADSVELGKVQRQAHVLRIAVKDVLDNDGDLLDESRRARLSRAYRWSESPAEGAARLRVE